MHYTVNGDLSKANMRAITEIEQAEQQIVHSENKNFQILHHKYQDSYTIKTTDISMTKQDT